MLVAGCGDSDSPSQPGAATGDGLRGVTLVKVGDFDQPLYVTAPPGDSRDLYVVEQTGRVMVLSDGEAQPRSFLDISDRISCCGEQGLLSLAFAPDYGTSGRFYVDFTNRAGDTRVVEYRRSAADPLVADPDGGRTVLGVEQPYANHNGGLALFGPGGLLYVGLGDGGSEGDPDRVGQDPATPLSKILKIDPRRPGAEPRVFATGLRNPWRFSFDRTTGALWIGDVGQSEFEEVDGVSADVAEGSNFGWSAYEGTARYNADQAAPGHVSPVLVYTHDEGCSVTGGYVVRDRALRSLYGRYLYGDYCSGELRSFTARPGRPADDDRPVGVQVPTLNSFGEDPAGRIYATSLQGPVYRFEATSP